MIVARQKYIKTENSEHQLPHSFDRVRLIKICQLSLFVTSADSKSKETESRIQQKPGHYVIEHEATLIPLILQKYDGKAVLKLMQSEHV